MAVIGLLGSAGDPAAQTRDPGALVGTTARSTVGVLLDELPRSMRARVTEALVAKPPAFWHARAIQQLELTGYRLVFRQFFYSGKKQQLPLPPEAVWKIVLAGQPKRIKLGRHDYVAVPYDFSGTLLTDVDSPGASEPRLRNVGGTWRERFVLPIDPEMLLQRTGYACMNEDSFPFPSVDSEEANSFYDQSCAVEKGLSNDGQCHYTRHVRQSCMQALRQRVGRVRTPIRFERLAWDAKVASDARYGEVTGDEPDLQIYLPDFLPIRITYRYINNSGCEVVEQCVNGTGWRRLLQFATSDQNVGNRDLTIGGVDYFVAGDAGELDAHNLFELSACHHHYHFKYYGTLGWQSGQVTNAKQGFCLQSTARTANRETSPLHNRFSGCGFQGVAPGWVDQYKAGLPCQWVDITDSPTGTGRRSFRSNPNGFLCEGTFVDQNGNPLGPNDPVVWAPTGLTADNGRPVEAPLCRLRDGWDANDEHETDDEIPPPGEGLITSACTRGQLGPKRNCGLFPWLRRETCSPGKRVSLTLSVPDDAPPQVVRVCEFSHVLDTPIPCRYEDSFVPLSPGVSDQPYRLANAVLAPGARTQVSFVCPKARTRGAPEPGGAYSIYTGAAFPDDAVAVVTRR